MNNKSLIKTFLTSGICITGALLAGCAAKTEKPNIIYIFTDEQNIHELSAYLGGDPVVQTPNLDQLAREGVQYTRYVSNNSICVPFRATLMTGQYSQNNGMAWNTSKSLPEDKIGLQPTRPLFAVELKKNGYKTGYVGKWHLYPESKDNRVVPEDFRYGFTDYYRRSLSFQDRYNTTYSDEEGNLHKLEGYAPIAQMDQLIEFIKLYKDEPFCGMLSWHPPHPSYKQAPEKWMNYYRSQKIKFRENVPEELRNDRLLEDMTGAYAHVSAMDEEVGRLMQVLKDLKIEKNTIVIFTSDHGDLLKSHGWIGKSAPWNESILVPFIIRWPAGGIKGGKKVDIPLSGVHMAPTLLGFAGIEVPKGMDGTDYSSFMRGKDKNGPETAFIMGMTTPEIFEGDSVRIRGKLKFGYDWRGVYNGQYTYALVNNYETGEPGWLFDNINDPLQLNNLINNPDYKAVAENLKTELKKYLDSVNEGEWLTE